MSKHPLHALVATSFIALASCAAPVPDQLTSDFDFTKHAFSFENFDDSSPAARMTMPLAIRMFGADVVCRNRNADQCEPNELALAFIQDVNQTMRAGHSEGMARAALLFQLGKLNPADFGAESPAAMADDNAKLLQEIVYWSATQKVPTALIGEQSFEAKDVMPFLAKILKPGEKDAYRLAIVMKTDTGLKGGHAVVPFGYFKGEKDGQYLLRLYDNNMPAREQRMLIDTKANSWSYEGSPDPAKPLPYSGNGEDHNRLYFSPVVARMGVLQAPFADDARALAISTDGVEVTASDETGAEVGVRNGEIFENGGTVRPGFAACVCQAPHQIVNIALTSDGGMAGKQTIAVGSVGQYDADGGTVNITAPGLSSTVTGVHSVGNQSVTVDSSGKSITYNSSGNDGQAITVSSTVKQADGSTTQVSVTINSAGNGVTIDASDPKNVKVSVDGTQTTASVTVTNTTASGAAKTTSSAFTTGAMGGTTTVNTETNTSTVVKSTFVPPCENGTKDGTETDTDCGLTCVMATGNQMAGGCANGQRCLSHDDCKTQVCTNSLCRSPGCDDGKKNLDETDVDCGGPTCRACAENQACSLDRDCAGGIKCFNITGRGQCLAQETQFLHVVGLGPGASKNLPGSIFDGQTAFAFTVQGREGADFMMPFRANRYSFYDNGTAVNQDNVSCNPVENPDNYFGTMLLADAGTPLLRCTVAFTKLLLTVRAPGCFGRPKFAISLNGVQQTPFEYVPREGYSSWTSRVGDFRYAYTLYPLNTPVVYSTNGNPEVCTLTSVSAGAPVSNNVASDRFTSAGTLIVTADCTCAAPVDAGIDAGVDAGRPDAGYDAGFDAGFDAGRPDAGFDAGQPDAGPTTKPIGATCTLDSECTNLDCECGANSGNCTGNTGRCGAGKFVVSTPTADGVAVSGTFTVPASCPSVRVAAWGAAGGSGYVSMPFPSYFPGGAGGFISGTRPTAAGDVFSIWVGGSGTITSDLNWPLGQGSYAGTAANGGYGQAASGFGALIAGGGGGLTSVRQTGSVTAVFSVPAGGGGSMNGNQAGGEVGSGNATTRGGGNGTTFTSSGGGGAGENGGLGGTSNNQPGKAGAFASALPGGLTSAAGSGATPAGTTDRNFTLCPSTTATGAQLSSVGGNGCVVLRCVSP